MAMNGTLIVLYANIGTPTVPVYSKVGSQRDMSKEEATATIDASSKDSRAQRVLPGRYSSTLSLDALYVPDDAAYLALQAANRDADGEMILVAREEDGVTIETALAKVDSISEDYPDQDVAAISIAMTIDNWWIPEGS